MRSEVYIFGAGTNGELCLKTCKEHGVSVAGILDNYSSRPNLNGAAVLRPGQADKDISVVVTSPTVCMDIMNQLDWLGFSDVRNLSQFNDTLGIEPDWQRDLQENRDSYEWLRERLGDDESRRVFDAVVMFRKTLETSYLAGVQTDLKEQWFDPEFFQPGRHVYVDGGAYDGDTALEFIRRCPEYKEIYLFEPSVALSEAAKRKLMKHERYRSGDISIIRSGLSDALKTSRLQNAGLPSGSIAPEGEKILLTPLDHCTWIEPSFIKLDVEGSEKKAILGAEQKIRKHRPFIACAVYHRPEDLWEIPLILSTLQDYKFYLRHYTQFYHETVLYCL